MPKTAMFPFRKFTLGPHSGSLLVYFIEGNYNNKSGNVPQEAVVVAAAKESIPHAIVLRRYRKVPTGEIMIWSHQMAMKY